MTQQKRNQNQNNVSVNGKAQRTERLKSRNLKRTQMIRQTSSNETQASPAKTVENDNSQININDIYLDTKNPASYSSSVRAFLEQTHSISVHKKRIKNFNRRKIIVPGPYHSIAADLIDYSMYATKNSNYKYILCVVDMFSRLAFAEPLKNKTAEIVSDRLDNIIGRMQFVPKIFTSDKGGEFDLRNKYIHNILVEKYHMIVYYTTGSKKNSMVERYNRTLKERLERFFTENNSKRWIDILEDFVTNINATVNRSIGIAPNKVNFENSKKIWRKLYPNQSVNAKCDRIQVGDRVRIPLKQNIFSKGYHQAWTDEIFTVDHVEKSMGTCLYHIKDNLNERLPHKFYTSELNFVSRNVS